MSKQTKEGSPINESLIKLAVADIEAGIKQKFNSNQNRAEDFYFSSRNFDVDFSKTHISAELLNLYLVKAEQNGFEDFRLNYFSGHKINVSEDRSVLHTLLRSNNKLGLDLHFALIEEAEKAKHTFECQYSSIKKYMDSRPLPVKDIIHVGIGGSSLGPQLIYEALSGNNKPISLHFLSNIDAHQLDNIVSQCDPATTLVFGVSKTFTTLETIKNLNTLGEWFDSSGNIDYKENLFAITANSSSAKDYGIQAANIVSFPEWVGGRYSIWSSVSLSVALVVGMEKFDSFLQGAAEMDHHFLNQPLTSNLPFIAACLDHYYVNYMNAQSRGVFAYDYRLRSLVAYLQQLETESNGKDRQRDGAAVEDSTSAIVWGGIGTDVQHSVFQMLHQGTNLIPAEFLLCIQPDHQFPEHHKELLANVVAQTAALLEGQTLEQVEQIHKNEDLSDIAIRAKQFSGDRPSTTFILQKLDARTLGGLLAFYEHRTFTFGALCNINSFDQMGVELGKRLAKQIKPRLEQTTQNFTEAESANLDASTIKILKRILQD